MEQRKPRAKKNIWQREKALEMLKSIAQSATDDAVGEEKFLHQSGAVAIRAIEQANKMCGFQECKEEPQSSIKVVITDE